MTVDQLLAEEDTYPYQGLISGPLVKQNAALPVRLLDMGDAI